MNDTSLKLRIRKLLWLQGYYCPLEVDLSYYEYENKGKTLKRNPMTDIDVLGIRFESDLRKTTIVVDCKSGKESEPNRMFWLKGVMEFFNAQEGILLKSELHKHARPLAPRLGIRAIDEKALKVLEKSIDADSIKIRVGDQPTHEKAEKLWGINVPSDQKPTPDQLSLKGIYQYLQYLYWMIDEYRNIQTLIEKFSQIKSQVTPADLKLKYLAYIGLQRLTLSILKMASEIAARDMTDIKHQSYIYLFGGPFFLREREQIITLLNKLTEQRSLFKDELKLEPSYFEELVEIVNKIISNSVQSIKMLQHLDAVIFECVLNSEKKDIKEVLSSQYSVDALVILKRIAVLLQKNAGLNDQIFGDLMSL